jgi:flagellar hook-associated protein 3 FlgL
MPLQSIGDMSRHFLSLRQNVELRSRLSTLTQELSTGRAADLTAHLRGDSALLADLDRRQALTDSYAGAAKETGQMLAVMQLSLDTISTTRDDLAGKLIVAVAGTLNSALDTGFRAGRASFDSIVQALNVTIGGQSLFVGTATGASALASPEAMMASLSAAAAAAGVTTAADLAAVVDAWFDDPAGGFATTAYRGDTGATMTRRVDVDAPVPIDARADDPALRNLMKATALAALAGEPAIALPDHERRLALQDAGMRMVSASEPLATLQARLGLAEATVEEAGARHVARRTAFGIMRNDLVSADPFDTSISLQAVQQQLEIHYTLTARLSRLSLVGYLR